jgi:hypothetical protein
VSSLHLRCGGCGFNCGPVSQLLTVIGSYVSRHVRKVLACMELKGLDYEFDPITPFFGMGVREARRGMMQV